MSAPVSATDSGSIAFTVPAVPAGMNAGGGFQGARRRRSDSNDASARAAGRVERLRGRWRKLGPFGVHAVIRGVVGGHRQERPSPDMERDAFPVDPVLLQTSEQTWREMKPRGRSRDRTRRLGIHGLIVGAVTRIRLAPAGDVGRQRHFSFGGNRGIEDGAAPLEMNLDLTAVARGNRRVE